jgi:integrase
MGKSHQEGWVSQRGKQWYGYYRKKVLDPETGTIQLKKICIKLGPRIGPKSKMNKSEARDALRLIVTAATGQNTGGKVSKDSSVTFEWFVRNRYLPLRMGNWRPETAKEKISQIELDLIDKFGEYSLDSFDKVMLQTHINDLATRYSQDRVKQARSYLKSIFDEIIEDGYQITDPSRRVTIPTNLRPKDKQILTWDQLTSILVEANRRDRILLLLEMTDALRPGELFALRWRSFDGANTMEITETVYRRVIRPFGKTPKSLGKVHIPDGLNEDLLSWKLECPNADPDAFIFPNADGGMMDTANYRSRVLGPMAKKLGIPKLNFQVIRRTIATRAQKLGSIKDIQAHLRHTRSDTSANEYVQELAESVQMMVESVYKQLNKGGQKNKV